MTSYIPLVTDLEFDHELWNMGMEIYSRRPALGQVS